MSYVTFWDLLIHAANCFLNKIYFSTVQFYINVYWRFGGTVSSIRNIHLFHIINKHLVKMSLSCSPVWKLTPQTQTGTTVKPTRQLHCTNTLRYILFYSIIQRQHRTHQYRGTFSSHWNKRHWHHRWGFWDFPQNSYTFLLRYIKRWHWRCLPYSKFFGK